MNRSILVSLSPSSSFEGVDLKELSFEIAPILSAIFQQSLNGVVPSDWKNADVAPAFKKGGRNLAENYRPISLTYAFVAKSWSTLFLLILDIT